MKKRPKFTLGQRVRFKDIIIRDTRVELDSDNRPRHYRSWRARSEAYSWAAPAPGEGVLVGIRTFQDGWQPLGKSWEDHFYGFERTDSHRVVIIATALHLKPVHAFLEDVEAVE